MKPGEKFLVVVYAVTVPSMGLANKEPDDKTNDSSGSASCGLGVPK